MANRYATLPGTVSGTPPRPPQAPKVNTVRKAMKPATTARRNMVGNLGRFAHPKAKR